MKKCWYYLSNAVRDRRLIKSNVCEKCGVKDHDDNRRNQIEAHHYLGYEKENWLKVKWLCVVCHKEEDKK